MYCPNCGLFINLCIFSVIGFIVLALTASFLGKLSKVYKHYTRNCEQGATDFMFILLMCIAYGVWSAYN